MASKAIVQQPATKPSVLGRTLDEIIAEMPPERQARIKARAAELIAEVEGLKALRKLTERSQEQIAQSLGIKQPAIVKMERQTDLYLSTLRRFVEAAGGKLELRVELPGTGAFTLTGVGEIGVVKGVD
jgi:DNA-binding XRE family transcriptional regulator